MVPQPGGCPVDPRNHENTSVLATWTPRSLQEASPRLPDASACLQAPFQALQEPSQALQEPPGSIPTPPRRLPDASACLQAPSQALQELSEALQRACWMPQKTPSRGNLPLLSARPYPLHFLAQKGGRRWHRPLPSPLYCMDNHSESDKLIAHTVKGPAAEGLPKNNK